jgi:hypothetical protein
MESEQYNNVMHDARSSNIAIGTAARSRLQTVRARER